MNSPLVSVNILSFNRKDELKITLTKVFEQDYKNIEVIVVDNASSDGTQQMVKDEFPKVNLIELGKNIGIAGWNRGFEIAKGDYVLVLDDDSYPENNAIRSAIDLINSNYKIGIVAFQILNNFTHKVETEGWPEKPYSFIGCGALIEMSKLETIGFFDKNIHIYFNELELTLRFLNRDFLITYCQDCRIIHNQSLLSRGKNTTDPFINNYRYYHSFWSLSYVLLTKFSFPQIFFVFSKWLINRFIVAIKHFYFFSFIRGVFNICIKIPLIINNRKPLNKKVQKVYNYGNIFSWRG